MLAQLTLNRNYASCTSTWQGIQASAVEVVYTSPSWDYDNVTISVPAAIPPGSVFNSVQIQYTVDTAGGSKSIQFSDTRLGVTNASLLTRLQEGERELRLLFSYKAAGGSGRVGVNTSTCTWRNITITVDYTDPSRVHGETQIDGSLISYSVEQNSLMPGQSGSAVIAVTSARDCSSVTMELRPHGAVSGISYTWEVSAPAGRQTVLRPEFLLEGITLTARVTPADIRFTLDDTPGQWIATTLNLVRERLAPVVSAAFTDIGQDKLTSYVQGKSVLRATLTVTADTEADSDITLTDRTLVIDGRRYVSGDGTFDIDTTALSGSVGYTASVTDSYGITGTLSGTLTILPYAPPSLSRLEITRYIMKDRPEGGQIPVADDDGAQVWVTLTGSFSPLEGGNRWTLTAIYDGTTRVMQEGAGAISFTEDTALLPVSFTPTTAHTIRIRISDIYDTADYSVTIPKAGGIFNIERGGVAVGKRSTGTTGSPKFECAYPAVFEAGAFDGAGNPLGGNVYTAAEVQVGAFLGKPMYRKVIRTGSISYVSSNPTNLPTGLEGCTPVRIDGMVYTSAYGCLPANCYHSGNIMAFARLDTATGNLICYTSTANSGAVYILDYIKESL